MLTTPRHLLAPDPPHYVWDNSLPARLRVDSGDTVTCETRDAGDGQFTLESTSADLENYQFRGHPLTGPIYVDGARPGDVLQVDVLDVRPASFGWTAIVPELGLLPEDFPTAYLRTWDLSDGREAHLLDRFHIPLAPFCGVMGGALAEMGEHSTMPPRHTGGNVDIKHLVAGSTLYLPVEVDGALFSIGDAHAAQGDGEVCVSAIEMASTTTVRFQVRSDLSFAEPQFQTPGLPHASGAAYVTTGHSPDLMQATKQAVRHMIKHLVMEYGLTREDAYCLCSVAVDLKISEVVDAPNWIVSAFLPLDIVR
jgi:acetamidase/formamidase